MSADLLEIAHDGYRVDAGGHPQRGLPVWLRVLGRCERRESDCWEWTGATDRKGYGRTPVRGRKTMAHRAVFIALFGELPPDMCVCHRCDNPPCCNPAHLFVGTKGDNNRDRQAKGRTRGLARGRLVGLAAVNAAKTHCKHGHEFTPENTIRTSKGRACRTCCVARTRQWRASLRAQAEAS